MLTKSLLSFVLVFSFLFSALPLSAKADFQTLLAASQWQNADETDAYLQTPSCRAFTNVSTSTEPVQLSLSYPKDGKILPMISLRTKLAPALIAIKISKKETEYLFPIQAAANNGDANLYWYAPLNFAGLESLVKNGNSLDLILDPKGTPAEVKISLKGSGNAVEAAKKCLRATKTQFPSDFFKLLNSKKDDINPNLGDRSPALMARAVQDAYDAFLAGQSINAELSKLRKANEPLLSKERSAASAVKKANEAFVSAKTKLDTALTQVDTLTVNLNKAKKDLADFQTEKPKAEADLAAKKAVYLPLKAQMAPYEQNVAKAAKAVKETADDIEDAEHTISRNTRLIPQLESEKSSLNRQIPGLEQRANSLRREYDDADSDYRRYDVRRETENFLQRDFNYSWAKRDLEQGEREMSAARSQLSSAESALRSCQATPNSNCSSQQSAVSQAQSAVSSAQHKISNARWKISSAESDASRKANSEADRLRRIRDDASSAYSSALNAVSNARARVEEIRSLIPRLRAAIAKAEAALPGLRAQLASQQAELAAKTSERDAFSRSIGFGIAETNFNNATKHLADVNDGIKDLTKAIPKITKELAVVQKTVPSLTKSFNKRQAELTAAQAKLVSISEQLKSFRALEKVQLDARDVQAQKFKVAKATYQELYLELTR